MRDRLIAAIIADRTRVLTLLISGVLALSGTLAAKLFGVELTPEHQANITLFVTLLFGWAIEAWAADQNAKGVAKTQQMAQRSDPSVKVDGFAGPQTIASVRKMAADAPTQKIQ